jgi:hypothetical protein
MGERWRLQLTHGMRVGEHKGIEHGEKWVRWIRQEKEAIQWGVEGGEAHASGKMGCWHPECKTELATSRHVLCVGCAALGDQRGKSLMRLRDAIAKIGKALQWEPRPKDKRYQTIGHKVTCEAYKQIEEAKMG